MARVRPLLRMKRLSFSLTRSSIAIFTSFECRLLVRASSAMLHSMRLVITATGSSLPQPSTVICLFRWVQGDEANQCFKIQPRSWRPMMKSKTSCLIPHATISISSWSVQLLVCPSGPCHCISDEHVPVVTLQPAPDLELRLLC